MRLGINITGGNHVLRRSLLEACAAAGHHAALVDDDAVWTDVDAAIVIDPSLVPPMTGQDSTAEPAARRARRVVLACSKARTQADVPPVSTGHEEMIVVRSSTVYGIATDPLTTFLIMMRSLPAVPVLRATHKIQPVWHEDLARALVSAAAAAPDGGVHSFDVAGPDPVMPAELYDRIAMLIDRRPLRIPVPDFVAEHGAKLAAMTGLADRAAAAALDALSAPDAAEGENMLPSLLGAPPTPLDSGLRRLIAQLDEVTAAEGVGSVQTKRFHTLIRGSHFNATELLREFRRRFAEMMPIPVGVEPAAPAVALEEDAVLTMTLPGRGHVQIRVQEVRPRHVVVATLRGHALAGTVRFQAGDENDGVRFEVITTDAAANAIDWLTLSLGGARIQDGNWTKVVQNVVELSGGRSDEIETEIRTLART